MYVLLKAYTFLMILSKSDWEVVFSLFFSLWLVTLVGDCCFI